MGKGLRSIIWLFLAVFFLGISGCGAKKQSMNVDVKDTLADIVEDESGTNPEESLVEEVPEYFDTYSSLAVLAEQYGFKLGAVIGAYEMMNEDYKELMIWHFNSITASNEMKAYSLLDQRASQNNEDGMPVMNYEAADQIVSFARDNGIGVRGHALVWDAYMKDWFFREGYQNTGEYVDTETMKERLRYYIEEVIGHFERNYPGVVYCWDVVNEAVADDVAECETGDDRHLRMYRNGEENPFYTYIGPDYVELAFMYARDAVDKLQSENSEVDIKLFYNDYNTFYEEKRDAICVLVESINSYSKDANGENRKLCDGIGMQSYIGGYGQQAGCMNNNDLNKIEAAILQYSSMGMEVHATELAVRNYENDAYTMEKHADFYRALFEVYKKVNAGEDKPLTSVTIWGLCDNPWMSESDYGYKMNGPYCGLFDEKYHIKDSFRKVYALLSAKE